MALMQKRATEKHSTGSFSYRRPFKLSPSEGLISRGGRGVSHSAAVCTSGVIRVIDAFHEIVDAVVRFFANLTRAGLRGQLMEHVGGTF